MRTLTIKSNQSAEFFLCQYVRDPFRQEPRNVGVIVRKNGEVACQFHGEHEDDGIDGRSLRGFEDPDNYRNWVRFWKRTAMRHSDNLAERLLGANREAFRVVIGGYLGDIGDDPLSTMVDFLFHSLVSESEFDQAIKTEEWETKPSIQLSKEIAWEFRELGLTDSIRVPRPIYRNRDLIGATRPWRFEFVQMNGTYVPMEVLDFRRGSAKAIDRHASWTAKAFEDVVAAETKPTNPFAIVTPPSSSSTSAMKDAYERAIPQILAAGTVVDWSTNKKSFLEQRMSYAFSTSHEETLNLGQSHGNLSSVRPDAPHLRNDDGLL